MQCFCPQTLFLLWKEVMILLDTFLVIFPAGANIHGSLKGRIKTIQVSGKMRLHRYSFLEINHPRMK